MTIGTEFTTNQWLGERLVDVKAKIINIVTRKNKTRYVIAMDSNFNNKFQQVIHIDGEKELDKLMNSHKKEIAA